MGKSELIYDDSNLQRLFAEMDVKARKKALKGAFRKEANAVKKVVINNLRASLNSNKDLEKGVRSIVYRQTAGFRVTVGTKSATRSGGRDYGYHINRQGLKKPILIWAEGGTALRRTKTKTRIFKRARKGHPTGRMKRYGYMSKSLAQVRDKVTRELQDEVKISVQKTAQKYGCK